MTDIQQVEGAAVVSWDNWGDQYSGPSQGTPGFSLAQQLEYGADGLHFHGKHAACCDTTRPNVYAIAHGLGTMVDPFARPAQHRRRSFRRGLKGLFR